MLRATVDLGVAAPSGLSDDFNRANSSTGLGGDWTARAATLGIASNEAYPVAANWNSATHITSMTSDDMEVSFTLGAAVGGGAGDTMFLILGANSSGQCMTAYFSNGNGYIYSIEDFNLTGGAVRNSGAVSVTTGDKLAIRRVSQVYSLLKNDVPLGITWTDSGDVWPRDSSHRIVGFCIYNSGGTAYRAVDSWEAA